MAEGKRQRDTSSQRPGERMTRLQNQDPSPNLQPRGGSSEAQALRAMGSGAVGRENSRARPYAAVGKNPRPNPRTATVPVPDMSHVKHGSTIAQIKAWLLGIKKRYQRPLPFRVAKTLASGVSAGGISPDKQRLHRLPTLPALKGNWPGMAGATFSSGVITSY